MQKIALISNREAGSAGDFDVAAGLARSGVEVETLPIERAADAAHCGADRIAAAGGDGSIAPAAAAAAAADLPLAVIPVGTANDFANRMGLPEDPEEATRLAGGGERTRVVDLARIGGRPFVNAASLGLASAAADAAAEHKDRLGALAYTVGALRAAGSEQPVACRLEGDDTLLFSGRAWQVTVGCSGAFGGGSQIDADADDGLLDVVVIEEGPRLALARRAIGMRSGKLESQEGVRSARCARIVISLDDPGDLNVDGELIGSEELGGPRLEFSVQPRAVRLVTG